MIGVCGVEARANQLLREEKRKERTTWPASLIRSFLRVCTQNDYTERSFDCREVL